MRSKKGAFDLVRFYNLALSLSYLQSHLTPHLCRQVSNANTSPEAIADNAMQVATTGIGELDVPTMKKYIQYCKAKCHPRLSEEAGDILASSYVKIRDDVRRRAIESAARNEGGKGGADQAVIPITVRQLEALIRLSESLSKMRLEDEVQGQDIAEALRLFKVSNSLSTIDAMNACPWRI